MQSSTTHVSIHLVDGQQRTAQQAATTIVDEAGERRDQVSRSDQERAQKVDGEELAPCAFVGQLHIGLSAAVEPTP